MPLPADHAPALDDIRRIVADVLELEVEDIADDGDIIDDYEADSLLLIEITARLENGFGIQIPQETVPQLRNVNAIRTIVADLGSARAS
ncbi:acyl carrier protein [Streptomyces sp. 8N616]|uniref:acyl carrier protein n=1 Tax=Streptomyces sp. 8N616 TaxID=3457414 RepID=UPI003FCF7522